MSALEVTAAHPPQPVVPQTRRRRDSTSSDVEVVGHTLPSEENRIRHAVARRRRLGVLTAGTNRRERPSHEEREVIVISDEDDEPAAGPSNARRQRRRLMSPPPPPQDNSNPPVPLLMRRLATLAPQAHNLANHQHLGQNAAPRNGPQANRNANNFPFDFEENNRGPEPRAIPLAPVRDPSYPPQRPIQAHRNEPQPFPEVHPRVALGGGGLFGARGRHAIRGNTRRHHLPIQVHMPDQHQQGFTRFRDFVHQVAPMPALQVFFAPPQYDWGHDAPWGGWGAAAEDHVPAPPREESPDYLPEWTHPAKPQPGFSNTFADEVTTVILENGETREEKNNRSVCSRCGNKLVINGTDEDGNRIYAGRCGHLFDARCFVELAKPVGEQSNDKKGKGKSRAEYYEPLDTREETSFSPYRLRSRSSQQPQPSSSQRGRKTARGGRRRKGAPAIAAQHFWKCPVKSCEKVHVSLQYEDDPEWVQDKERGAIAMFI